MVAQPNRGSRASGESANQTSPGLRIDRHTRGPASGQTCRLIVEIGKHLIGQPKGRGCHDPL
jgi:hypothetical protein